MSRTQYSSAFLAVLAFLPVAASANLLSNPGFEIGNWDTVGSWSRWDNAYIEPWAAQTGTNGVGFYGWSSGGGIYQNVSAQGSSNYVFSVWGLMEPAFPASQMTVELKIEFANSGGTNIHTVVKLVSGSPDWSLYSIAGVAPADTAVVRPVIAFGGAAGSGGGFKWDDAVLVSQPLSGGFETFVSTNGANVYPYTNWAMAADNIQAAVDAVDAAGTVRVNDGRYRLGAQIVVPKPVVIRSVNGAANTYVFGNRRTRCFALTQPGSTLEGFTIRDGYVSGGLTNIAAGVYAVGSAIRHCTIEENHLNGGSGGDWTIYQVWGAGAYLVGGSIEDCVVRYNMATNGQPRGAGVFMTDGARVSNCLIQGNEAVSGGYAGGYYGNPAYGAGVYAANACSIRSSRIVDNRAIGAYGYYGAGSGVGAGVYCSGGVLEDCMVSNNFAEGADQGRGSGSGGFGAGVYASSGARVDRCVVTHNTAKGGDSPSSWDGGYTAGGGIYGWNAMILNCLVNANTATGGYGNGGYGGSADGGGIYCSSGQVVHCTIVDNTAVGGVGSYANGTGRGGGLYNAHAPAVNCIAYFNTALSNANLHTYGSATATHFCTTPDPGGAGHVTGDPAFLNPAAGNYRLLASSPCIDAGAAVAGLADDLDGTPRPLDGDDDGAAAYDIGAYEYLNAFADSDGDGLTDTNEMMLATSAVHWDTDGDSMGDNAEIRAGTSPTDPASALEMNPGDETEWTEGSIVIEWSSVAGRTYSVLRSEDISAGFTLLQGGIAATAPMNSFTDPTAAGDGPYYYKVEVEQ